MGTWPPFLDLASVLPPVQVLEIFSCTIDAATFACGFALLYDGVNTDAIGYTMVGCLGSLSTLPTYRYYF